MNGGLIGVRILAQRLKSKHKISIHSMGCLSLIPLKSPLIVIGSTSPGTHIRQQKSIMQKWLKGLLRLERQWEGVIKKILCQSNYLMSVHAQRSNYEIYSCGGGNHACQWMLFI